MYQPQTLPVGPSRVLNDEQDNNNKQNVRIGHNGSDLSHGTSAE